MSRASRPGSAAVVVPLALALALAACGDGHDRSRIVASGHVEATEVRISTKVGGTVAASGIVHGHGLDVLTQVIGFGSLASGVIWGQMNATNQTMTNRFYKGSS